jgi:tetratricopeptide (TPR) repeat protein
MAVRCWSRTLRTGSAATGFRSELRAALLGEQADAAANAEAKAEVRAAAKGRSANAEAYRLYLQGRYFEERPTEDDVARAIAYYREAVATDSAYAVAWAGLARASANQAAYYSLDVDLGMRNARDAALRALRLEAGLAEAHEALGRVQFWYDWDWSGAEDSFRRALELAPEDVIVMHSAAQLAVCLSRLPEAIELLRRAAPLDPLSAVVQRVQAMIHHACGRRDASEAALAELIAKFAEGAALQVAEVHASRGEADAAFEWLERAYAQRDAGLPTVNISLPLQALHGDPRWRAFLARMKLAE